MRVYLTVAICLASGPYVSAAGAQPLRLDFSASPLEGLLRRAEHKAAVVEVPRCAKPPVIDGDLQDAPWQAAAAIQIPAPSTGASPLPATRALLAYDDAALYMGVVCDHQPDKPPVAQERKRDEGAWQDDCVEVWMDTSGEGDAVYQFVVNAAGAIYDQNKPEGPHYNPEWQQAAGKQDCAWTVEIAIPLRALQLAAWPAQLNFNIGRNGPDITPRAWNGGYGDTSAGLLRLAGIEGQAEAVRLLLAHGANVGAKNIKGQTPIQVATQKGHTDIVELLTQHGAGG